MRLTEQELQALCDRNPHLKIRERRAATSAGDCPTSPPEPPRFDSQAEERFYNRHVLPGLLSGIIISSDVHKTFEIMEAVEHCGHKYKNREYTPDFVLAFRDGTVEVVEIKGKQVKKMQRDYPLRKQLFILKYCIPNGWKFIERPAEEL